jgi:2-methylisocitrate lyase-like PEP mutase family enzyme
VASPQNLSSAITRFHALHESGCFVLPNPWDIRTAVYLERIEFKALATTSAGFAFSRGQRDGGIPRDEMVGHIRQMVNVTELPVNADFQADYADKPATPVAIQRRTFAATLSGLSTTGRFDLLANGTASADLNKLFCEKSARSPGLTCCCYD